MTAANKNPFDVVFGAPGAERRISALAIAILVLTVLATGGVIFSMLAQQLRVELENGLERTLHDKVALFQLDVGNGAAIGAGIASRQPRLAALLSAINAGAADQGTRRESRAQLDEIRLEQKLSAIALYDARGELVATSGAFLRAPFAVSLRQPENASLLWSGGYYLGLEVGLLKDGAKSGTVRLEYPLAAMTSGFLDYRGAGETGEVVLCAPLPGERMRCFPTRSRPEPFDSPRVMDGKALPLSLAIEGKSGVGTAPDYRAHEAVAAYQAAGESGLGVAVKSDTEELMQPIRRHLPAVIAFLAALLLLGFALLRWQMGNPVREVVSARARLDGILDNSADGIITIDEQGVIESFNHAAARVFGYPASEVIGANVAMLIPEPYRAGHGAGFRDYLNGGEAKVIGHGVRTVQGQRKDGTVFPMELALGAMTLDGERMFIASLRDTSALKQAHDELQSSFAALQSANRELEEVHAQLKRAEQEKDRQMDALAESNVRMMLFHANMERVRQAEEALAENRDGEAFHRSILADAMTLLDARFGAIGLFDRHGTLRQFLTEGISAAEREKIGPYPRGKGLLRAFYKEGKITRVGCIADDPRSCGFPPGHPPMGSLLGVPLVVSGTTVGVIYLADKQSGEPFTEQDEMLMEMVAQQVEHVLERNELLASLHESNQALTLEREEQQSLIADLKAAQNQLLQSEKMASIGQLAAGVAHEINNPIGYVHSNLGTLEKYILDLFSVLAAFEAAEGDFPPDSASLARIRAYKETLDLPFLREDIPILMAESREGITRVKKIVQDLKDFSHVDEAEWQWCDLHRGLDSTLNIVWNELKYKAEVIKEYGVLPEIECIPSQLNQVFMNLLVNAGHAIESHGAITIRTGREGDEVWVEVADSGKGIAPEHLARIFDPFFTTKPVGQGTGLGLSLSYGIVKKHHGRIEVESAAGKGTTFRVWLPVKQADRLS